MYTIKFDGRNTTTSNKTNNYKIFIRAMLISQYYIPTSYLVLGKFKIQSQKIIIILKIKKIYYQDGSVVKTINVRNFNYLVLERIKLSVT